MTDCKGAGRAAGVGRVKSRTSGRFILMKGKKEMELAGSEKEGLGGCESFEKKYVHCKFSGVSLPVTFPR